MSERENALFMGRLSAEFPSQIIVDVTEQCNLSCVHCASPAFRRSALYSGAMLDLALNEKLCAEVMRDGRGITQYLRYAASGEPLLNPNLESMLAYAVKYSGTLVALTTNGTLLDEQRTERILSTGLDLIDISIDASSDETYARVRRSGSLDVTKSNVRRLLALRERFPKRPFVVVSFVEQPHNTHEIEAFKGYWHAEGVDDVVIRRLHSNGGANRGVASAMRRRDARRVRTPCLYPWERLVLGPTGLIGFCPADWTHMASVADFRSTTIRDVWQGTFLCSLRRAHCENDFTEPAFALCAGCPDWASTRWPDEGCSYADMVSELAGEGAPGE